MNDIYLLLLIALVSIGLGYALGTVFSRPGGQDDQTEANMSPDSDLVEVARLWRVPGERDVYPQMESRIYKSVDDLSDEQWKRLYQSTEDLRYWMKGYLHLTQPSSNSSPVSPEVTSFRAIEGTNKLNSAKENSRASAPPSPPSLNPVNILARAVAADANVKLPAPSIAAQVDEILQENLENSPLKNRGIRLMELPDRGMVVMVGMDQYDGVDAVPDPDVQGVIRSAVAEWEARMTEDET